MCQILITVSILSPNASVCLLSFGEKVTCQPNDNYDRFVRIRVMVFNATFNNILAISWGPVLLVEETEYPEKTIDLTQVTDQLVWGFCFVVQVQTFISGISPTQQFMNM